MAEKTCVVLLCKAARRGGPPGPDPPGRLPGGRGRCGERGARAGGAPAEGGPTSRAAEREASLAAAAARDGDDGSRGATAADATDPYARALRRIGGRALFAPVLWLEELPNARLCISRALGRGSVGAAVDLPPTPPRGLILTSPRAAAALAAVLRTDTPASSSSSSSPPSSSPSSSSPSTSTTATVAFLLAHNVPCFVVGAATSAALCDAGIGRLLHGVDSGSAARLAADIIAYEAERINNNNVNNNNNNHNTPASPYLFLCGNSRRDTIPRALASASIPFTELVVYASMPLPPDSIAWPTQRPPSWIVFFSPNGVRAAVRASFSFHWPFASSRLAAIGQTTADAMRDVGLSVDAVPSKPHPAALVTALVHAISRPRDHGGRGNGLFRDHPHQSTDNDISDDNSPPRPTLRPWELEEQRLLAWQRVAAFLPAPDLRAACQLVSRTWLRRIDCVQVAAVAAPPSAAIGTSTN
jgi:uroporphyrinogen-III synthase